MNDLQHLVNRCEASTKTVAAVAADNTTSAPASPQTGRILLLLTIILSSALVLAVSAWVLWFTWGLRHAH